MVTFNDGKIPRWIQEVGEKCNGVFATKILLNLDIEKQRPLENQLQSCKQARQHIRAPKRKLDEEFEDGSDNPTYGAGMLGILRSSYG